MEFSQIKQAFQTQQSQSSSLSTVSRQQLTSLPPAQRLAFYQHSLIQQAPIHILSDPNEPFSNLSPSLKNSLYLIIPFSPSDTVAQEASQTLYSSNEFLLTINHIPLFSKFHLIAHLAILFGPPLEPAGGSHELSPLLNHPSLTHLRLIFQDRPFKGLGPSRWLRPCMRFILKIREEKRIELRLQLKTKDDGELDNVTRFLDPLSGEEEAVVVEARRRIDAYKGLSPSYLTILVESGWSFEMSEKVVNEWMSRAAVREWVEEARKEDGDTDVEMTL